MNVNTKAQATPTQLDERIQSIDILRGIALLGILLVNMAHFSTPILYTFGLEQLWEGWGNKVAETAIALLAQGKFYPIFSFLFGVGFMIFMDRAEKKGQLGTGLFKKRLAILLVIGLLHALLIWYGDILTLYALLGFLMLRFRHLPPRSLVKWAIVLLLIPVLLFSLLAALTSLGTSLMSEQELNQLMEGETATLKELKEASILAYGQGTFSDAISQRLRDLSTGFISVVISIPTVFAMFLLGMYAVKSALVYNLEQHRPKLKKIALITLGVGLPFLILQALTAPSFSVLTLTLNEVGYTIALFLGGPVIALFYISSIALLTQRKAWLTRLRLFGAVGRMSLSNYLFQSVLCTSLFYGYGFGLYGKLGPLAGLGLALLIYGVQLVLSHLWLQRFTQGPMEWLWKRLTYGRLKHS